MSVKSLETLSFQNPPDFFDAVAACMGEGLIALDTEDSISYINPYAENLLGLNIGEFWDYKHPLGIENRIEDNQPGIGSHHGEALIEGKDGREFPVVFTTVPLQQDGKPNGTVVFFKTFSNTEPDLCDSEDRYQHLYHWESKTHQALQLLRKSEKMSEILNIFVEQAADVLNLDRSVIITFDSDGNPCPVEFEYLRDPAIGSFRGMIPPWGTCPFLKACDQTSEVVFVENVEETPYWQDDFWRNFYNSFQIRGGGAVGIRYKNEMLCVFVFHTRLPKVWTELETRFIKSIAEQTSIAIFRMRMTEAIEQVNQRKSQFISNMSHEFRTPLNAVIGYSQMMQKGLAGDLNEKQRKYINNIVYSGKHLLDLVNAILDLEKIETGKVTLNTDNIQLAVLMEENQSTLEAMMSQKNVTMQVHIQAGLAEIQADMVCMKQILLNLLSNAIKFNRENGRIQVNWFKSGDEQWIVCEVKDTGCGIPNNKVSEIFTEFYQVDNSFSRRHEGTGLGLTVTKKLIELHQGTIAVESQEGIGSTFTFHLPVTM